MIFVIINQILKKFISELYRNFLNKKNGKFCRFFFLLIASAVNFPETFLSFTITLVPEETLKIIP